MSKLSPVGKFLRKKRRETRKLMITMADEMEVSPSYLSEVEAGERQVSRNLVAKIEQYFKLDEFETAMLHRAARRSNIAFAEPQGDIEYAVAAFEKP